MKIETAVNRQNEIEANERERKRAQDEKKRAAAELE
jgi:hypothetical protein